MIPLRPQIQLVDFEKHSDTTFEPRSTPIYVSFETLWETELADIPLFEEDEPSWFTYSEEWSEPDFFHYYFNDPDWEPYEEPTCDTTYHGTTSVLCDDEGGYEGSLAPWALEIELLHQRELNEEQYDGLTANYGER
jgi:hypothetical protein